MQQPGRIRHADRITGGFAESVIRVRGRIRPVRAKDEHVDPEHTDDRVDGAVGVAGCLDEHARINDASRQRVAAAPGGQALTMQRR